MIIHGFDVVFTGTQAPLRRFFFFGGPFMNPQYICIHYSITEDAPLLLVEQIDGGKKLVLLQGRHQI